MGKGISREEECGRDTAEIPTSVDALGDRGRNN